MNEYKSNTGGRTAVVKPCFTIGAWCEQEACWYHWSSRTGNCQVASELGLKESKASNVWLENFRRDITCVKE